MKFVAISFIKGVWLCLVIVFIMIYKQSTISRPWLRRFGIFLVMAIFLLIIPLLSTLLPQFSEPIHVMQAAIAGNRSYFLLIRWGLLAGLIVSWPYLIQHLGRGDTRTQAFLAYWSRWRLLGWLVVIELLFVQEFLIIAVHNIVSIIA